MLPNLGCQVPGFGTFLPTFPGGRRVIIGADRAGQKDAPI